MAYIIHSVVAEGLSNRPHLEIVFHRHVNFLIGRNGTGKTTVMRALYAALSLNIAALERSQFTRLLVSFKDIRQNETPQLEIVKEQPWSLQIRFRESADNPFVGVSTESEITSQLSGLLSIASSSYPPKRDRTSRGGWVASVDALRFHLTESLSFSWLPLLRSLSGEERPRQGLFGEKNVDPIAERLDQLNAQITSFLSQLDFRIYAENQQFQRRVFSSLLEGHAPFPTAEDLAKANTELQVTEMFKQIGFFDQEIGDKISTFFASANDAVRSIDDDEGIIVDSDAINKIITIVQLNHLADILSKYVQFQQERDKILMPRTLFLDTMNSMLFKKIVDFDTRNSTVVYFGDERVQGTVSELSSGERQLYLLMGEVMSRSGDRHVFLADEPELSLHVDWQVQLVDNLLGLNPTAQIIFATHSPDIVAGYQDNTFDFEKL